MNSKKLGSLSLIAIAAIILIAVAVAGCTTQSSSNGPTVTPAAGATPLPTTRTITDMAGRTVTIPYNITKVLGTAPPITMTTYMLDPNALEGWNSAMNGSLYVPNQYLNLPNVGGQQMGQTLNYETFLSMNPDLVLYDYSEGPGSNASISDMQSKLNPLPVVAVYDSTNASDYTPEIQFMGNLLGAQDTANKLIQFYNNVYTTVNGTVASIPMDQRKTVYYAEGTQGLQTESPVSMHAQIINIAGGINVANITDSGSGGMTAVSMEQVIAWNPDVIICGNQGFYNQIYNNSNWANIKAVQDKQVYLVPSQPYGWIDRPPGVNSIIGIPWMAKVLYPDQFQSLDMVNLTQEFYSDFYHYNLTSQDVHTILSSSGLTQY